MIEKSQKKLSENHKKYEFSDRMWRKEWDSNPPFLLIKN